MFFFNIYVSNDELFQILVNISFKNIIGVWCNLSNDVALCLVM